MVLVVLAAVGLPDAAFIRVDADGLSRPWALAVTVVVVALAAAALTALAAMLRAVEQRPVFHPDATRHFRRFALLFMLSALAAILLPPLVQLSLALKAGGGEVTLSLSNTDLATLAVGAALFFVARLFDEAARLDEDSRSIV